MKNGGSSDAKLRQRKDRVQKLDRELKKLFPDATCALHFSNPWELLVAVVLSAQCTDKMVNKVTETLFKKYTTLDQYVQANPTVFEQDIKSTGFYRSKAKHILASAKMVKEKFDGRVPCSMEDLLTLPGVARKTANIILGNACGIVEGIAVDTHVKRFAIRYDLTNSNNPEKIEQDLMAIVPKKDWFEFTYRVIEYGRHIAPARTYDTSLDPLIKMYPPAAKVFRV